MMNTNGFETNARVLYDVRVTDPEGNLVKLFSEEFTVTPSKITRSIQRYEERDLEQLKKHSATGDENEYLTRAFSDIRMAANGAEKAIEGIVDRVSGIEEEAKPSTKAKSKTTKTETKSKSKEETPKGNRGGRPRNRRWEVLNRVFEKHGLRTKSSELYELAEAEAEKEGLPPLNRHSFYSMLSIARSKAGISMRQKKEDKDKQKH